MGKFVGCPLPVWRDPKIVKRTREGKIKMPKNKNPKKGKVLYGLWLTKEEEKGVLEVLGNGSLARRIGDFINKICKRGDLVKR